MTSNRNKNTMISSISEMTRLWDTTLAKLEKQFPEKQVFDSLFSGSYINNIQGNTIEVVCKSMFAAGMIKTKYVDLIADIIYEQTNEKFFLVFVTQENTTEQVSKQVAEHNSFVDRSTYFKDAKLDESKTFENYVVGQFNNDAFRAASFVASAPGKAYNPLFIYSHSGLGKTHLMNAIGNHIKQQNKDAVVLYINASLFLDEFVKFSKGEKESQSMRDWFKDVDVLLLDDVQYFANREKTQEMFFYVYGDMLNRGKQIVITSDRQPNEIEKLEDRLVTRFTQGLVIKINDPDTETCVRILKKKIEEQGLDVNKFDETVLLFTAEKFSRDVRELEGALNRLKFSIQTNPDMGVMGIEEAVSAVSDLRSGKKYMNQLDSQKIINVVSSYYNLDPRQLTGKIRTGQIALARHIAMYLIRSMIDISLEDVGKAFGGKDHTTVMSAIKKVEKELATDPSLQEAIEEIKKRLEQ